MLLADQSGDVAGWASVLASVANIGFAGLVGWYLLTRAMPKLQDEFKEDLNGQRRDFKEELKIQRDASILAIEAQRDESRRREELSRIDGEKALQLVIKHCEVENERHANIIKGEVAGFGKIVQDNREVMEEVRDALIDFQRQGK